MLKPKPKKTSAYANKTPSVQERMERFKNDPKAQKAVDYMTTSKGYQSDPLKARGGSQGNNKKVVTKGTISKLKQKVKPKF